MNRACLLAVVAGLILGWAAPAMAQSSPWTRGRAGAALPLPPQDAATAKARRVQEAQAAEEARRKQVAGEDAAKAQQWAALCAAPPPDGTPPAAPLPRLPGSLFRECPDCPEMVVIPPGGFSMGAQDFNDEQPVHRVTIDYALAVGRFEVTQAEWHGVMGTNPSAFKAPRNPVEQVSWHDAQDFIRCLNFRIKPTQSLAASSLGPYRLLTEAEWEYAARAGSTTAYPWGDTIGSDNANCARCGFPWEGRQSAAVGSFPANAFGLHDMIGNVEEWTQDCYAYSYRGTPSDGGARIGPDTCYRVNRGGSWFDHPRDLRSAARNGDSPGYRNDNLGFRVARPLP